MQLKRECTIFEDLYEGRGGMALPQTCNWKFNSLSGMQRHPVRLCLKTIYISYFRILNLNTNFQCSCLMRCHGQWSQFNTVAMPDEMSWQATIIMIKLILNDWQPLVEYNVILF